MLLQRNNIGEDIYIRCSGNRAADGLAPEFEETIIVDGNAYFLQNINYETLSKEPKPDESAEQVKIITSEPFTDDKENHLPEKEREEDGKFIICRAMRW